jgi:hypothetical protein
VDKGREGAGRIKNQMEARAAYAGTTREEGAADNLEVLADWATAWRRKVYRLGLLAEANASQG